MSSYTCAGLLTTVRWLTSIERSPCTTRKLRTIERLQAWSIFLYYPLEHITYLLDHQIIPAELSLGRGTDADRPNPKSVGATIKLNYGKLARASMGLWGAYLSLQLLHLFDDNKKIKRQERLLGKSKVGPLSARTYVYPQHLIGRLC